MVVSLSCVKNEEQPPCTYQPDNSLSVGYNCGDSEISISYLCWSAGPMFHRCQECENLFKYTTSFFIQGLETVSWIKTPAPEDTGWICNKTNSTFIVQCSASNVTPNYDWSFLFVGLFILAGGLGNILVCLAIAWERRLQNITNYFLFSLAIADLLVSLFVMPMGAIQGFLGKFVLWKNVKGYFKEIRVILNFRNDCYTFKNGTY